MFARTTVHIGSWSARMAFLVLHTGVPLALGMPFFDCFEPHILWRRREYLIYEGRTTHVLRSDLLPVPMAQRLHPFSLPIFLLQIYPHHSISTLLVLLV